MFNFEFLKKFIVRSPLLPFCFLSRFDDNELLAFIHSDKRILESLFLASKSLHDDFLESFKQNKADENLLISLKKYLTRMSSRSTPFGLFAGVSLGVFQKSAEISYTPSTALFRKSRLDMHVACLIYNQLLETSDVRSKLNYHLNNTLYKVGDQIRYMSYSTKGIERNYTLMNVENNYYLEAIINLYRDTQGGLKLDKIVQSIQDDDASREELGIFVNDLISSKLLISELEPGLNKNDYLDFVLSTLLERRVKLDGELKWVGELKKQFDLLGSTPIGEAFEIYRSISSVLNEQKLGHDSRFEVQVDLIKNEGMILPTNVLSELRKSITLLARITKPEDFASKNLNDFKSLFQERYEDREVPLLEVLDDDIGIGFPVKKSRLSINNWMLKDLNISNSSTTYQEKITKSNFDILLEKKYLEVLKEGLSELVLKDDDLKEFQEIKIELPESIFSQISLLADSIASIEQGQFEIVHLLTAGPSASNMFSRFAIHDASIAKLIEEIGEKEKQYFNKSLKAEIIHIADNRMANILIRPDSSDFQIPVFTPGSLDTESITLEEIMVSIVDGKIILRSKKNNCVIEPRLTSAHNFQNESIPFYHFLGAIQFQAPLIELNWAWSSLHNYEYLPRVRYGKTILDVARWQYKNFTATSKNVTFETWQDNFLTFCKKWSVPDRIYLVERDNKLLLSLSDPSTNSILYKYFKKRNLLVLEECIWSEEKCLIKDSQNNGFVHELIIPAINTNVKTQDPLIYRDSISNSRTFIPGSEWVYYKLYCSKNSSDTILVDHLKELVEDLQRKNLLEKWFFLRYADPNPHIRIRFKTSSPGTLIQLCHNYFLTVSQYLVHDIKIDTYSRELERYGNSNIDNAESLFHFDSSFMIEVLSLLRDEPDEFWRNIITLKAVENTMDVFNLTLEEKILFCEKAKKTFYHEFDINQRLFNKTLSSRFKRINKHLNRSGEFNINGKLNQLLMQRHSRFTEIYQKIMILKNTNKLGIRLDSLLGSCIHMTINRMYPNNQRLLELFIYDLLLQKLKSQKRNHQIESR